MASIFSGGVIGAKQWMMSIIKESGASHCLHFLNMSDEICKDRLHARNEDGTHDFAATEQQFEVITSYFSAPMPDEGFDVMEYR
ncbi:AAA family ATPase [Biostraticola tofi]|uniref:AAA family ATPase n=1 Tax=Biostraticola tofi TaxID=466109 RepID=UPI001E318010|nr:AAA family ATPase [Biostraticola tofi]